MRLVQITTIQIKSSTKRRLQKLGRKGDTYDDIVRRLINGSGSLESGSGSYQAQWTARA
jgi:hypothetical protein